MMLTCTTEISCPPERAFSYVTDPSRFGEWQRDVLDGCTEGDGPVAAGTRCVTRRRIGLAARSLVSEITHLDPPNTWCLRGVDGPIRATVHVTVEPIEGAQRTRVTIAIDFEGHGVGKLLVPLFVRAQARREMPVNLRALKQRLEDHG